VFGKSRCEWDGENAGGLNIIGVFTMLRGRLLQLQALWEYKFE
jgi:hypothetical protein